LEETKQGSKARVGGKGNFFVVRNRNNDRAFIHSGKLNATEYESIDSSWLANGLNKMSANVAKGTNP